MFSSGEDNATLFACATKQSEDHFLPAGATAETIYYDITTDLHDRIGWTKSDEIGTGLYRFLERQFDEDSEGHVTQQRRRDFYISDEDALKDFK